MSIENISAVTSSSSLAMEPITSRSALSRPKSTDELPKIEFKTKLTAGPDELQKAVDAANHMFNQVRPDIKFLIDEVTNNVVIALVEPETGEVISRYPTEQTLAIGNAIIESQASLAQRHEIFQSANNQLLGLFVEQKI